MAKTCDSKCVELAEYFLADQHTDPGLLVKRTHELALEIQQCVEDYLESCDD